MPGVKISLGTAARGAALDGGSAAAVLAGGAGTLRPRGAVLVPSFARAAPRQFCNRLQDDVVGRARWRKPGSTRLRRRPLVATSSRHQRVPERNESIVCREAESGLKQASAGLCWISNNWRRAASVLPITPAIDKTRRNC